MAKRLIVDHTILPLFILLIFSIVIKAEYSSFYNTTANDESIRSRRSPGDESPDLLEAMIIDHEGNFLHLKWRKQAPTLFNQHTPVWIARRNEWGTYHEFYPIMENIWPVTLYYDHEQNSAVIKNEKYKYITGAIDTGFQLNKLPIELLHQCHRVGGPYVTVDKVTRHGKVNRPRAKKSDIDRFENCGKHPRSCAPSTSRNRRSIHEGSVAEEEGKLTPDIVNKIRAQSEVDLGELNITKIRTRRDGGETHYYIETLLIIRHDVLAHCKKLLGKTYLGGTVFHHLYLMSSIDMILAKLRKYGIYIHMNLAGIIMEEDEGAVNSVIELPSNPGLHAPIRELYDARYSRYLNYYDLPFTKDSADLIYHSTFSIPFMKKIGDHRGSIRCPEGTSSRFVDIYKSRQILKHSNVIPSIIQYTRHGYQSACTGAHEIGHILNVAHDRVKEKSGSRHDRCNAMMQPLSDYCYHCSKWSEKSVGQIRKFVESDKLRCFFLNYPKSLSPPGPTTGISAIEQCRCYGYNFYRNPGTQYVPADSCGKRLECVDPGHVANPDEPTILPFDGTPCGKNKVCWRQKCVKV